MKFPINFNEEKNLLLKETRGVNFDDVIEAIEKNRVLDDLEHRNKKKYPNQRILIVRIRNYAYVVPYVVNRKKRETFLKTAYPSVVSTKKYLRKKKK